MTENMADIIFIVAFMSILLVFLTLITLWTSKNFFIYKFKQKRIRQSVELLRMGWKPVTVDSDGIPLIFEKQNAVITFSDYRRIMDKKNAEI